jgi:hypothetical protein
MTEVVKARFECQTILDDGYQILAKLVFGPATRPTTIIPRPRPANGSMELYTSNPNVFEFFKPKTVYDIRLEPHVPPETGQERAEYYEEYHAKHAKWFKDYVGKNLDPADPRYVTTHSSLFSMYTALVNERRLTLP